MRLQKTLARPVALEGIGLHGGHEVRLVLEPAPEGHGVVFVRDDLDGFEIPALQHFRAPMTNATRLQRGEHRIDTPEHLLSALFALGVDNVRARLRGPELPILDGSALPFVRAILDAGLAEQSAQSPELIVTQAVIVTDADRRLEVHPGSGLRMTAAIDFEHRHLGYQELSVRVDAPEDFAMKLAPARTFALRSDVERLREAGLARGGSLDNAILVEEEGVANAELRFPDEFVRHKLLDVVGDLALIGCPVRGRVVAWRSGHALHGRLVDAILASRGSWIFESPPGGSSGPPARPAAPERVRFG
jgi:UDP-3-O-[3-hydroxymyristoyl] N-acetylglucosamine deacetylase